MDSTASVIEALEHAPRLVVPLVREVPPNLLKRRPAPTKWSAHEHACHLSRVDRLYLDRLDHILAHPKPLITPYDPARDEADDTFLQMDLDKSLERYVEDRQALVARLRTLRAEVWARTAEHGGVQPLFCVHHVSSRRLTRPVSCVPHRRASSQVGMGAGVALICRRADTRALGGSQIPGPLSSVVLRMDVGEKCRARAVSSELLRRQRELDRDRRSASKPSGALEVR